ncbi:MAG: hypothetical protein ACOCT0_05145 [Halobacteriota archaeon]
MIAAFVAALLVVGFLGALSFAGMAFGRYAGMNHVSAGIGFLLTAVFVLASTGSLQSPDGATGWVSRELTL